MIPFVTQPSLTLGPVTVHAFGAIVAAAVLAGLALGRRRFARFGLDPGLGEGMAGWALVGGFVGAHVFSLVFYFPRELAAHPLRLFKIWEDISSFGSMLGGLTGIWLFLRRRGAALDGPTRWRYLDVAAFVFPFSLAIGRIACSLAHDHPGGITTAPLAISLRSEAARAYLAGVFADAGLPLPPAAVLATRGFHDLGWYEYLYLSAVVLPALLWIDRRPRRPGVFLAAFVALYMPVRFLLDQLRVSDARYAGLTPAQWTALAMLGGLAAAWAAHARRRAPAGVPGEVLPRS